MPAVVAGHGSGYQPTATKVIDYWFARLRQIAPEVFTERVFVDVGCGKGKVLIRWAKLLERHGLVQRLMGVESDDALFIECERRWIREGLDEAVEVYCGDAVGFPYPEKSLFWMFNPFDEYAVGSWCRSMDAIVDALVVLNNPVHANVLLEEGFILIDLWDRSSTGHDSWFLMWRGADSE